MTNWKGAVNMEYKRCTVCGKYGWVGSHVCDPEWEWSYEDPTKNPDDETVWSSRMVRARDAQGAAELAAEAYDEGDYNLVGGAEAQIWIRLQGQKETSKWNISGESVPRYYANEVKGMDEST
jgi:hypothetical protein